MPSKDLKIKSDAGELTACFAEPAEKGKYPAIILIHEVWGLDGHIRDVAERLAFEGYIVLAPDLFSGTGILEQLGADIQKEMVDPATRDEAQKKMRAAMAPMNSRQFGADTVSKLEGCFRYLRGLDSCSGKIAVLGFCFGGTYAYALAVAERGLSAAVPFYGHVPEPLDELQKISCPVLAFYGEKDERLIGQVPEIKKVMAEAHKNFECHIYPEAGHAFFNDTNPQRYNKEAATESWEKSLAFLREYLA